ncbi:MAG: response regulator, partial [Proteobacteria bacterium]|nr:response regulator [Pseudomonadota bacterium]
EGISYVYTFRDITERRLAREAQKRAFDEAVAANRAKTEFLANMSHELRTPLNAVIGLSEVIRSESMGPIGAEYLGFVDDIHGSGQHLLEIINDILNMSKIEMGELEINEEHVDLPNLISACVRLIQSRADEGKVQVSVDIATIPPMLIVDDRLTKQMLLNLLSNAVKFTPTGGSVVVRTRLRDDGAQLVQVQDSGIGIDPKDIERVLSPFGQVDGSLQREFECTGLGMPLVKSMIEAHGGELLIDSVVGEGTTVSLVFPPNRVSSVPGEAAPRAMEINIDLGPNDSASPTGLSEDRTCDEPRKSIDNDTNVEGSLRVLVAEDNRINQVLIQAMLVAGGHKVDLVENGREAVEAVRERIYDVVLMDIHMPQMDGIEATREIRTNVASACNVPIIAVTASAAQDDRARFLEAGMNDHVAKPIDAGDLHRAMARQCGLATPEQGQAADEQATTAKTGKSSAETGADQLDELNLLLDATFD